MDTNKKIAIGILVIGITLIGYLAWDRYLNKGTVAFTGMFPFDVEINNERIVCSNENCLIKVKPGEYNIKISKTDYNAIEEKITVNRGEKLVITAEMKKNFFFSEAIPVQDKYLRLLDKNLPLAISADPNLQKSYDLLFNSFKTLKGLRKASIAKMQKTDSFSTLIFSDKDTYYAALEIPKIVSVSQEVKTIFAVPSPAAYSVFYFDNSGQNQALKKFDVDKTGSGYTKPTVVTYFAKAIGARLITTSADGNFVFAIDSNNGIDSIYKIDIQNKSKENIADETGLVAIASSSDGKYLSFENQKREIWIVDTATRQKAQAPVSGLTLDETAWNEKNHLIYTSIAPKENVLALGVTEADSNNTMPLISFSDLDPTSNKAVTIRSLYVPALPSRIELSQTGDLKRIIMLVGKSIYTMDYQEE